MQTQIYPSTLSLHSEKLEKLVKDLETQFPDDEHRVFYTGITRTKKQLHIIETGSKYRYNI